MRRGTWAACTAALVLTGCGGVFDDLIVNCIDFDGPAFVTDSLPAAVAGQPYSTLVTVDIVREPSDDSYDYHFGVEGQLPPGLQVRQNLKQRRLEIYGRPAAAGSFRFTITVSVRDPRLPPGFVPALCWYREERSYTLGVAPGSGP